MSLCLGDRGRRGGLRRHCPSTRTRLDGHLQGLGGPLLRALPEVWCASHRRGAMGGVTLSLGSRHWRQGTLSHACWGSGAGAGWRGPQGLLKGRRCRGSGARTGRRVPDRGAGLLGGWDLTGGVQFGSGRALLLGRLKHTRRGLGRWGPSGGCLDRSY